jgi:hypothetical protein
MPVVSRELDESASASPSSFDAIVGNSDGFCDGDSDGCSELFWVALVGTSVGCIDMPEDGTREGVGLRANCETSICGSVLGTAEGAVLVGVYNGKVGRVGRKVGMPLGAAVGVKLGTREGPREGAKVS